jgi:hypothetical protein
MADCDSVDNTRVSGYSGVSLHLLGARGSASRFLARAVYVSLTEIEA